MQTLVKEKFLNLKILQLHGSAGSKLTYDLRPSLSVVCVCRVRKRDNSSCVRERGG